MKRYDTGRIYKLENTVDGLVYIGQTTQTLSCRMGGHRVALKKGEKKNKLFEHMRLIGLDNFKPLILIETLTNCTKEEMSSREDFYIKQFDSVKNGLNGRYEVGGRCEHGIQRRAKCTKCGGENICVHGSYRKSCRVCNVAQGRFCCEICNRGFGSRYALEKHAETKLHVAALQAVAPP